MRINRLVPAAAAAAPLIFVFLWSTGFIGARFGLPYIEPMTFLAIRMAIVVALHLLMVWLAGVRWPSRAEAGHNVVAGLLVHGVYLGGVFTAIAQGVPAAISALI
ncbi:MAG: EamA/RhaT family transporter, partial [Pseudolabrys sp.]|nr:EamA/RhaT family transporter [Pseudolabrys sp.]